MPLTFDRFTLDGERRELLDGAQPLHLGPKAFRLLEVLIEHAPRALSKRELYEQIWPDTFVDESNLPGLINEVRDVLGDEARQPRFIRTVHGFGYAFCGALEGGSPRPAAGVIVFRGRELPLQSGVNVLGRDSAADIQIDDSTVSRRHASITIGEDGATLEDLESKNGTFIGGVRLSRAVPLADRQTFVLGDASITFRSSIASGSTVTVHVKR